MITQARKKLPKKEKNPNGRGARSRGFVLHCCVLQYCYATRTFQYDSDF
jgi:hypothetical protein